MPTTASVVTRVARALTKADLAVLSDRDLLARFADQGDQTAFAAIVARHTPMVLGVCRRLLPSAADAEDACQAVFLLLANKAGRSRWGDSIAGWLYSAARRVAQNARVAASRRSRRESKAAVREAVEAADPMTARELTAALDEELDRLPPRYREPLVLCYLQGLTQDEAATRLAVPAETLKTRLKRGRKKLAGALEGRGLEAGVVLLAAASAAEVLSSTLKLREAILATATGTPASHVASLIQGVHASGAAAFTKTAFALAVAVAVAVGLGLAPPLPTAAQTPKDKKEPAVAAADTLGPVRIAGSKFRAARPISDARYALDGQRIVGLAGDSIYVWDGTDGSLIRTMSTGLKRFEASHNLESNWLGFAVHPKTGRVAVGGLKAGKTTLQVWDIGTGKMTAEAEGACNALRGLAWTPDGKRLLERCNAGWSDEKAWKLIVRDETLAVVHSHALPEKSGGDALAILALPGNREVVLWHYMKPPSVFDIETGTLVRTFAHNPNVLSDLALSADGKTLLATSTDDVVLIDVESGERRMNLPVLRRSWEMPRPLFTLDGKTAIVYDFRPIAYDVTTGKEKWRASFPTIHSVACRLCDVSPDGSTVLGRHGNTLARLDAKSGQPRDPAESPAYAPRIVWSPDSQSLFTRTERFNRTWTAWDAATGKRKFDLVPGAFAKSDEWKMLPDLFFINGGTEIIAGIERIESIERVAGKELLVFRADDGQCLRRLGEPLPDDDRSFRWMHPIGVDADARTVLMQAYAVASSGGPGGGPANPISEFEYAAIRWDPIRKVKVQEWIGKGHRTTLPRRFAPYVVTLATEPPDSQRPELQRAPAKVCCYSAADGRLVHELQTGHPDINPERIAGEILLTQGHSRNWRDLGDGRKTYEAVAPYSYDLWFLPSQSRVAGFTSDRPHRVALAPRGEYVVRSTPDGLEVYEPYVLRKAIAKVALADTPFDFEFSPNGNRLAVSLGDASVVVLDTRAWQKELQSQVSAALPANVSALPTDFAKGSEAGMAAARLLAASGDRGVTLLRDRIKVRRAADAATIKKWVIELDAPRFAVRERAEKELQSLGGEAEAELRAALNGGASVEATLRIERLVQAIESRTLSPNDLREVLAVKALEWMNSPAARDLLTAWAKGPPSAPLTQQARRALGP